MEDPAVSLIRTIGRPIRRALWELGLDISPVRAEFQARLVSETHVSRMFAVIAQGASDFLASQHILKIKHDFDLEAEIGRFYQAYLQSPFTRFAGGSRLGNLLWLDLIAKWTRPEVIIDSGTYRGASAWALAQGAPDARILSFDIDLSNLALRCSNVEYIERDWTNTDFGSINTAESFCYFDDHVDQGRRLKEAAERNIPLAIYDDDFPIYGFAPMAHGGFAIPKISFLLDDSLADGEVIEWVDGPKRFAWTVDRAKLDALKNLILDTERLPNLVAPLMIDQLPYRIVAIRTADFGAAARKADAVTAG
jgi:hypothetical protein